MTLTDATPCTCTRSFPKGHVITRNDSPPTNGVLFALGLFPQDMVKSGLYGMPPTNSVLFPPGPFPQDTTYQDVYSALAPKATVRHRPKTSQSFIKLP